MSLPKTRYSLRWLRFRTTVWYCSRRHVPLVALAASLCAFLRPRVELEIEVLALRHQLAVLQRNTMKRPRVSRADRLLMALLSTWWPNWRQTIPIVTPATVVRWQRRAFASYWVWKSRPRRDGRPRVPPDVRALIRQISLANPLWGGASYPWRIAQAGHHGGADDRRDVHGAATPSAIADVEGLSAPSRVGAGLHRLLRSPNRDLPRAVRPRRGVA
jgi:hypothetical protein